MSPDAVEEADAVLPPSNPILFLACGPLARRCLEQLHEVAEDLRVNICGQFGCAQIVFSPPPGDGMALANGTGLHFVGRNRTREVHIWRGTQIPGAMRHLPKAESAATLEVAMRQLFRQLHPVAPEGAAHVEGPQVTDVYAIIDLRDPRNVAAALESLEILRKESLHVDVTAILLTGRTAEYDAESDNRWKDAVNAVIRANDGTAPGPEIAAASAGAAQLSTDASLPPGIGPFHRVYLLDGRDLRRAWVQTLDEHTRMAAEFLLHHGLSAYRNQLRRHERSRYSLNEAFSEVVGSFACRIVHSSREAVSCGVAAALLSDRTLLDNSEVLLDSDEADLQQIARGLNQRLRSIFVKEPAGPAGGLPAGAAPATVAEQTQAAFRAALRDVCRERPAPRLKHFLQLLQRLLWQLRMQVHTAERQAERLLAVRELHKQLKERYEQPYRRSSGGGSINSTSAPASAPSVKASANLCFHLAREVPPWRMVIGSAVAVVGGCAALRLALHAQMALACVGAACSAAVAALTFDSPAGWRAQDGPTPNQESLDLQFRCQPSRWRQWVGLLGAAVGLLLFGAAAGLTSVSGRLLVWTAAFCGTVIVAAVVILLIPPRITHRFGQEQIPGDWPLHYSGWRHLGWLLPVAAALWIFLACSLPPPAVEARWAAVIGLGLFVFGWVLAAFPQTDSATASRPRPCLPPILPPTDIDTGPSIKDSLQNSVEQVWRWLSEALETPSPPSRRQMLHWRSDRQQGTFLDALDAEWKEKLAKMCHEVVANGVRDGDKWANWILTEVAKPDSAMHVDDLHYALVHSLVDEWLQTELYSRHWSGLLSSLHLDPYQLERFFEHALSPMWPYAGGDYAIDLGIIAVDHELGQALRPSPDSRITTVPVEWPNPGRVVLVRIVQGVPPANFRQWLLDEEGDGEAEQPGGWENVTKP
jgi:hypothetical protein